MTKQDQDVNGGGDAYQAGRDLTVHQGVTAEQMSDIMVKVAAKLAEHIVEGQTVLNKRFEELRSSLIEEFSKPDTVSDPAAFNDPDFQYVVKEAHEAYGRSGDQELKDELVRLLAERSAKANRSRIALVLNQAIEMSGDLTREDYAALAAIFLLKYLRVGGNTKAEFFSRFNATLTGFVSNLPVTPGSITYLESMRCVSLNQFLGVNIWTLLRDNYWYYFTTGFSPKELEEALEGPVQPIAGLLAPVISNYRGNLRFSHLSESEIRSSFDEAGLEVSVIERLMALHQRTLPSETDVENEFRENVPEIGTLAERWHQLDLQRATLTAIGLALAHSTLVSSSNLDAALEIWVQ